MTLLLKQRSRILQEQGVGLKQRKKLLGDDYHSVLHHEENLRSKPKDVNTQMNQWKDKIETMMKQNAQACRSHIPMTMRNETLTEEYGKTTFVIDAAS